MKPIVLWLGLACCGAVSAQDMRVDFDGSESAVTQHAFAHAGAAWSGGRIETDGAPALSASGSFHYEVSADGARVVFAQPVTDLNFQYVHGFGIAPGTARAFDAAGNELASAASRRATTYGAAANRVRFDGPVARVEFQGGALDAVTWKAAGDTGFGAGTQLNGTWLIAHQAGYLPGQGLTLEFLPENGQLFVAWFTWRDGAQRWLTAGGTLAGDEAQLALFEAEDGAFNADAPVRQTQIGTLHLRFTDCDAASAQFAMPGENRSGSFEMRSARHLLAGHDCRAAR